MEEILKGRFNAGGNDNAHFTMVIEYSAAD